jgi:hypothetical protein
VSYVPLVLNALGNQGIKITLTVGKLRATGPADVITQGLKLRLRRHRAVLIEHLAATAANAAPLVRNEALIMEAVANLRRRLERGQIPAAAELAEALTGRYELFDERAAFLEFEVGYPRGMAEEMAAEAVLTEWSNARPVDPKLKAGCMGCGLPINYHRFDWAVLGDGAAIHYGGCHGEDCIAQWEQQRKIEAARGILQEAYQTNTVDDL